MIVDIFIRTYSKDLKWLQYSLASITKFVTGYRNIVVCIPADQRELLNDFNLENIVTCPVYKDDYLGQQVSKLKADEYCSGADYVLYTDSDCIFYRPFNVNDLFFEGKPIIYKTRYEKVGDAICWKSVTEKALNKKDIEWEYMRRQPLIYKAETIKDVRDYIELIHNRTLDDVVLSRPYRQFSEFNVLGAFAESFLVDQYHFHDTDYGITEPYLKQFWSWSNLTNEERKEIEDMIK